MVIDVLRRLKNVKFEITSVDNRPFCREKLLHIRCTIFQGLTEVW